MRKYLLAFAILTAIFLQTCRTCLAGDLLLDDLHTWCVAKDGADSSSGHPANYPIDTNSCAKITIGAVFSAPPADGDTIIIWPGTYGEAVSCAKKVHLAGRLREGCIIQPSADASALTLAAGSAGSIVEELTLKSYAGGARTGLNIYDEFTLVKRCNIWGYQDGIYLLGDGHYSRFEQCYAESKWDAMQCSARKHVRINECVLKTTGDYPRETPTRMGALCAESASDIIVSNSFFIAEPNGTEGNAKPACVAIKGTAIFENCVFILDITVMNGNEDTYAACIYTGEDLFAGMNLLFKNCQFIVAGTSFLGTAYLAYITEGVVQFENCSFTGPPAATAVVTSAVTSAVGGNPKTEFIDTTSPNPADWPDDSWNNWWIEFTTGNNTGESRQVLDWVTADDHFYFSTAFTNNIEVDDQYKIYRYKRFLLYQSGTGVIRVKNCRYDESACYGTITQGGTGWAAAVNAEADTALTDYNAPTYTEFLTRTLAAADYFDPAGDTVDVNLIEGADATDTINAEADTALADYNAPTYAEFLARTLAAADYFDPANDLVEDVNHVTRLDPNALDFIDITEPNAAIADWTYRDWSVWLFRRFSRGCSASVSILRTYKDGYDPNNLADPNYILTYQDITSDGTTRLVGDVNQP